MHIELETLNMHSASLSQITTQIRHQLEDEDYTPITLLGKAGIGKTESIRDLAAELGIGYVELRLSHYQESDLIGLPYIDEGGRTRHAASDLLPDTRDTGQGILLLDEVTAAPKSMRSAVYQLLDISRHLGTYKLPDKWLVIACGNGPDDGGDFRGMEPAFLSRGFCWRIEENLRDWKEWALKHQINPSLIAFLSFRPEMLHVMDPERPFDMIACPRNWAKLSTQLTNMEKRTPTGTVEDITELEFAADGCVGCKCGPAFAAFYQYKHRLIPAEDIIAGTVAPEEMKHVSEEVLYLTAQSLEKAMSTLLCGDQEGINDEERLTRTANTLNWIMDVGEHVRLDMAVTILQDLTASSGRELRNLVLSDRFDEICPRFVQFAQEHFIIL